jgi:peptidyl-tRNA hydrolase, PTH1 family
MKIIFAQGNPEPDYEKSRHNVGFLVLNTLASELSAKWADKPKFHAAMSEAVIANEKILLVKPTTFYNETGISARTLIDFYKLDPVSDLLVIHDDFALPFGTIRIRKHGSDAGNNGIKSINTCIGQDYSRIRIGIWTELREKMDDAEFVLAKFSADESSQLKKNVVPQVINLIKQFCSDTIQPTSYKTIE